MSGSFSGKTALVTGASEGIGLALARALAGQGAKVVLAARSLEKLEKASAGIPGSAAIRADLRKAEDRENLMRGTLDRFRRLDLLVNNAGQGIYGPFETTGLADYRSIMELNVFAVADLMQKAIPVMRRQGGGTILNISSMVSKNYYPGLSAYASTKYALNAISLTARRELEKDRIIVSVLHPKMTATRFGVNAIGGDASDSRANGRRAPGVDTAEDVAVKALELLESGEAEGFV